jgi:hypothetical protein
VAAPAFFAGAQDSPIPIQLSGSDPDGDPLTYLISTGPAHGTLVPGPASNSMTYQPDPGYSGPDQFTFKAFDRALASADATISINVHAGNLPPIVNPPPIPFALATEEVGYPISFTDLLAATAASDPNGDAIQFVLVSLSANGVLLKNGLPVAPGDTLSQGEGWVWVFCPGKAGAAPVLAFNCAASDGVLNSTAVPVVFAVQSPPCAINTQWISPCPLPVAPTSAGIAAAANGLTTYQTSQALNELGESRWYTFPVQQGDRITVILSDLPADYDVFLFTDIYKAYLELTDPSSSNTLEKLANFGAEAAHFDRQRLDGRQATLPRGHTRASRHSRKGRARSHALRAAHDQDCHAQSDYPQR